MEMDQTVATGEKPAPGLKRAGALGLTAAGIVATGEKPAPGLKLHGTVVDVGRGVRRDRGETYTGIETARVYQPAGRRRPVATGEKPTTGLKRYMCNAPYHT